MEAIRIELDQPTCCGSKMCVNLAPDAFELRVEGYAGVKPGAEQSSLEALKKAARACPTQCIVIFRDGAEMDLY